LIVLPDQGIAELAGGLGREWVGRRASRAIKIAPVDLSLDMTKVRGNVSCMSNSAFSSLTWILPLLLLLLRQFLTGFPRRFFFPMIFALIVESCFSSVTAESEFGARFIPIMYQLLDSRNPLIVRFGVRAFKKISEAGLTLIPRAIICHGL
jgi:hypothetical protein